MNFAQSVFAGSDALEILAKHVHVKRQTLFWLCFWAVAVLLRTVDIAATRLWYDEIFTYRLAHLPLNAMLMATTADVHPPLYYFVVWMLYHAFPAAPDWASRIPSVLASLGALCLFWQVLKEYQFSPWLKYSALVLMMVMPFQIHYAIEARMYALLEFEFLFGVWMVQRRNWTLVMLAMVWLAYTQNYGLFYAAVLWLYALLRDRQNCFAVTEAGIAAAMAYVPWVPSFLYQFALAKVYGHWIQPVTFGAVVYAIQNLFGGYYMAKPFGLTLPTLVCLALVLGMLFTWKERQMREIFLLAWGAILIAVLVSLVISPVFLFRPLIAATPFLYLIAVAPLERAVKAGKWMPIVAIVFFVPSLVGSLYGFFGYFAIYGKADNTGLQAVDWVASHYQPGDTVLSISDGPITLLKMYAPQIDVRKLAVGAHCDPLGALSPVTRQYLGYTEQTFASLPAGRVWVVVGESALSRPCEIAQVDAILGNHPAAVMLQDDQFMRVGIWELEK